MMSLIIVFFCLLFALPLRAQGNMPGMAAMQGLLDIFLPEQASKPKVTSEWAPMIHKSLGNWTLMFQANGFLVDTQQSGPRGKDKLFQPIR
jgi:hypothetical protein